MTIRNLDVVFDPGSVALFGASPQPGSVGNVVARNLRSGGFAGPVWLVNPHHDTVDGAPCYADTAALPGVPDLAVIATPPESVPDLVADLAPRGTRGVVILTAGFGEGNDAAGAARLQRILRAAQPHCLRIIGPNCVGLLLPCVGLNASFVHLQPLAGELAFVSQSGAVVTAVLDWATARGIGFSHVLSLGGMADVDFGDALDFLAADVRTRAVLMYVEAVTNARKFMSAARSAARSHPVIVVKAGRHAAGAKAAASHTGALAGADAVYDAAFRRAGLVRVRTLEELFAAAEAVVRMPPPRGDRLAILSNGGGVGVLATDVLVDEGGRLAELAPETVQRLSAALPPTWSKGNPVDIIGDAGPERYAAALDALLEDTGSDAVLVLNCPTAVASSSDAAEAVVRSVEAHQRGSNRHKAVLTSWIGETAVDAARKTFAAHRIPTYRDPAAALGAFAHMLRYRQVQDMLMQTPPALRYDRAPDEAAALAVIEAVLAEGRDMLSEPEAKQLLAAYGIPVLPTLSVDKVDHVEYAAESLHAAAVEFGGARPGWVVKVISRDITHKSDAGGVRLDLESPAAAGFAAERMAEHLARTLPKARIQGYSVQPMVRRPQAIELIAGATTDPQFGPVILFGEGGTAVEVVNDKSLALPPLNLHLAHAMLAETRVYRRLQGYRDRPAADLDGIAEVLVRVARLVADFGEIVELDINPLLADSRGAVALDARVGVRAYSGWPEQRLAIRPYPDELSQTLCLTDGLELLVRPVRPEDEPLFQPAFAKLDAEDVRMRFFAPIKVLSHAFLARLTQIDYDRQMAFLALSAPDGDPGQELLGVARFTADPDGQRAEYAVIVRSDLKGRGLGWMLMQRIIDYARSRGIRELFGEVLRENRTMLQMSAELGFRVAAHPDDARLMIVSLPLQAG